MSYTLWWMAAVVCGVFGVMIATTSVCRFVSTIRTGGRGGNERYPGDTLEQQGYDERTAMVWAIACAALVVAKGAML